MVQKSRCVTLLCLALTIPARGALAQEHRTLSELPWTGAALLAGERTDLEVALHRPLGAWMLHLRGKSPVAGTEVSAGSVPRLEASVSLERGEAWKELAREARVSAEDVARAERSPDGRAMLERERQAMQTRRALSVPDQERFHAYGVRLAARYGQLKAVPRDAALDPKTFDDYAVSLEGLFRLGITAGLITTLRAGAEYATEMELQDATRCRQFPSSDPAFSAEQCAPVKFAPNPQQVKLSPYVRTALTYVDAQTDVYGFHPGVETRVEFDKLFRPEASGAFSLAVFVAPVVGNTNLRTGVGFTLSKPLAVERRSDAYGFKPYGFASANFDWPFSP